VAVEFLFAMLAVLRWMISHPDFATGEIQENSEPCKYLRIEIYTEKPGKNQVS